MSTLFLRHSILRKVFQNAQAIAKYKVKRRLMNKSQDALSGMPSRSTVEA